MVLGGACLLFGEKVGTYVCRSGKKAVPLRSGSKSSSMKNTINEEKKWKVLSSEYLVKRPWLTARRDVAELPDGRINHEYYVLEYPDWVNIIALTKDGQIVMERQYRHALGNTCYELPCGVIEAPNPATSTNLAHSFLAVGVEKVSGQHLDATEDIDVYLLSQDEVRELLVENQILQALMAAPLWKYFYEKDK